MADKINKLGVIGAGVMGRALIRGLLERKVVAAEQVWAAVKTNASRDEVQHKLGVFACTDFGEQLSGTDVLLLCIKPNTLPAVLERLKAAKLPENTLLVSIVAGSPTAKIEALLGTKNPVVRAMTNTPCIVGQGMTAICSGTSANDNHMAVARDIFEAVGVCMELDESHFDAITGLSGSGPAYMYLIMEALADGGVRVGLPRDAALKIVSQTVLGAAMMVQQTGRHPAALRDDVTTPAGCTIGALLAMEDGKIRSVLARAVEEATRIAGELGHLD